MGDDVTKPASQAQNLPDAGYPPRGFDFIFSDGATGLLPGSDVVKITLAVTEPNFRASEPNKPVPVAQVIMPTAGFIQSTQFFLNAIDGLVQSGLISKERVEELRNLAGKVP